MPDLNQIERRLERLEAAIVQEYSSRKMDALRDGQDRIVLSEARLDRFAEELGGLQAVLYATGDPKRLQIVSEQHDAIRIRMVCLQHLLEREIPKPYADQALFEGGDRASSYAAQGRLPTTSTSAPARNSLLGRVFRRTEAAPAAPAAPRPSSTSPITNQMRLGRLHKLLEEDRQKLMAPEERPPSIQADVPATEAAYRFKVKFVAEAHHGQRVATDKIARTPEELRAKLAKRAEEGSEKKP